MTYGRVYDGRKVYRVWVKGKKLLTERLMKADSKAQAQLRLANVWSVKSFEVECVWLKDWPK